MLRELVRLYKYERVEEAGEELRRLFAAFIGRHRHVIASYAAVAVVPVPMHPFREAYRGFNQAEVLASVLAAEAGLPLRRNMLKRGFRFAAQAKLADDRERSRNARGSVVAAASASRGAYLLVDDVVTTGATLEACALALKAAGATEVRAITLLRGSTLHNSSVSR
jgi:ComF family protein